jgi:tripartite-type tricarboxylate transporter receptor subunit TctC
MPTGTDSIIQYFANTVPYDYRKRHMSSQAVIIWCLTSAQSSLISHVMLKFKFNNGGIMRHFYALLTGVAIILSSPVRADQIEDFYKGKTINFIIGLAEGGGYDLSARLAAQHLGRFIPGHPTIVPRTMPAAGGIAAAEYVYNIAPRDGTVLAMFQSTFALEKLTDPSRKFESQDFSAIGRIDQAILVGFLWTSAQAHTLAQAKEREIILAANAATGTSATMPWTLNRMIGTKFKVVMGYISSAQMGLALEKGEADGLGSTSWDFLETKPQWFAEHKMNFMYVIALERFRKIPDVPTILELTDVPRDKAALRLIASTSTIGRSILSTPHVPPDHLTALRRAFDAMSRDDEFLKDAQTRHLGVDPLTGEKLQQIILDMSSQPRDVIDRMIETSRPQ